MNKKLKILVIAPFSIYPPKEGGSIYVYNYTKALKEKGHEINFITVKDPNNEDDSKFKEEFKNIIYISKKNIIKSIFSFEPYRNERLKPNNKELIKIKNLINSIKYDIIIFEGTFSSIFYKLLEPQIKNIKKIFIALNIDYIDVLNRGKNSKNIFLKLFYFLDALKLKRVETNFIKKFNLIFSISLADINNLKQINPKAIIKWFPPIIYISEKNYKFNLNDKMKKIIRNYKNKILFTGSLNSISNIIAVQWFTNEVMPILRKRQLNCCFIIVGRGPNKNILELQNKYKNVFVFFDVESLAPFYDIADLVVIPLFNNAGVKIKLIEALKYRKKVVSRPEGVYGSGLREILPIADSPEEFAQRCIDVLNNKIDFKPIWDKFNEIYDSKNIIYDFEKTLQIYCEHFR